MMPLLPGGGAGGAWSFLSTYSGTNVAALDIPIGAAVAYLLIARVRPASAGADLRARVTTDGFSTIESGASDYAWVEQRQSTGAAGLDTDENDAFIRLGSSLGNATSDDWLGEVRVYWPSDAALHTRIDTVHTRYNNVSLLNRGWGAAAYKGGSAIDGLRLYCSTGNIAAHEIHVYALTT